MPRRVSLTSSPLARPKKLIHALAARVQDYIYFPTPDALYLVLGTLVGNMMKGKPVWMMLIGAPSTGRTLLLDTLADIPRVHFVGSMKTTAALLSATSAKERSKTATGGLLRKIGLRGMMVHKDFTSILSLNYDAMKDIVSALREVYDGTWGREVGSDGGDSIVWGYPDKGRLGFLGASTPKLDQYHSIIQELGQRWLYFRYPATDGFGETMALLRNKDMEAANVALRELVSGFIQDLGIDWDSHEPRDYDLGEENRLYSMGVLMTRVRTQVSRDGKTKEIDDIASPEGPSRMSGGLGQLYLGLEAIGLDKEERWKILSKVALDSAPQLRVRLLEVLRSGEMKLGELRKILECGKVTLDRIAVELRVLGVVAIDGDQVRLSDWAVEQWLTGWQVKMPLVKTRLEAESNGAGI